MQHDGEHESERLDLDRADAYGQSFADVYDQWYAEVTDAQATAAFLSSRCDRGLVLELGVGSGRLAIPMTDAGMTVIGVDGSPAMLGRVPARPARRAGGGLSVIQADMRALPVRGRFDAILIAFNTLFNLAEEREQAQLLVDVATLLTSDGILVIEALDATPLLDGPRDSIGLRSSSDTGLVVTATQLNGDDQTMTGQHVEISDDGISLRPWRLRWLTSSQLDHLASEAGLELAERYGGWDNQPLTETSETHISVYRPHRGSEDR